MLGATDCMDGCGLGGYGKNPLEYSDTSSSSSSTTRKIITNPFLKSLQKPTKPSKPSRPSSHMQCFVACQDGQSRIAETKQSPSSGKRDPPGRPDEGPDWPVGGQPQPPRPLKGLWQGPESKRKKKERGFIHIVSLLGTSNPCIYCTYVVVVVAARSSNSPNP